MKTLLQLQNLEGRVAVITGGGGQLGYAMGEALAELGATVVIVDINREAAESAASRLHDRFGHPTESIVLDIEDDESVRQLPDTINNKFGQLNVLINNAAFYGELEGWSEPFEKQTVEAWRKVLNVNLTAAFGLSQACAPLLGESGSGSIINISSLYALVGPDMRIYEETEMTNPAVYSVGKAGTLQLTRWLATVLAPNVRVNSITPGGIFRGQQEPFLTAYCQRTPLGRMATEEDFKGITAYLASDLSAYMTGQNLVLDGGWTAW